MPKDITLSQLGEIMKQVRDDSSDTKKTMSIKFGREGAAVNEVDEFSVTFNGITDHGQTIPEALAGVLRFSAQRIQGAARNLTKKADRQNESLEVFRGMLADLAD